MKTQKRAFTLIELLVVIAIIAILAAILFPVFAKARERAKTATCTSNMGQLAKAVLMYADDYDGGTVPAGINNTKNVLGYDTWMELIQPYVKNYQVGNCPSVKGQGIGMNHKQIGRWIVGTPASQPFLLMSKVKEPGDTVIFADSGLIKSVKENDPDKWVQKDSASSSILFRTPDNVPHYSTPTDAVRVIGRHSGRAVCAFMDGHVKAMLVSELGFQDPKTGAPYAVYDPRAKWDVPEIPSGG